jgi:PPOX class probable F420-dependent enzyme
MARMTADVLRAFLAQPHVAVLATLRRDGRPYLAPVWFHWEKTGPAASDFPFYDEGRFWLTGTYARRWCKNLRRDPRASLCIEATDPVARYAAVDCDAELVEEDIWPMSEQLARKYVGARAGEAAVEAFLANMKTEPRLLFRLTPQSWRCIDLTVYRGVPADQVVDGNGS